MSHQVSTRLDDEYLAMFHNLREKHNLLNMNKSNSMREIIKRLHWYEFQNIGDRFPVDYMSYVKNYYDL